MKKIILTLMGGLVASMFLFTENAQAQGFQVSGSVGITGSSVRTDSSEPTSTSSISFSPAIGWELNKNWVVGIRTTLGVNTNKIGENKTSTYSLTLNPYVRYQVVNFNDFGLWAEADPSLSAIGNSSSTIWTYGISIVPVLTYKLTDHFSLESRLNIFSIYMQGASSEGKTAFGYGFKASSQNTLGNFLDDLSIGFVYHF